MCGRFALSAPSRAIQKHFDLKEEVFYTPRYNIAPDQEVAVVRVEEKEHRLCRMRWGFVPHWSRDSRIGYKMINARSETLHEKPSFKEAFKTSRCLIPADGFYEWKKISGRKDKQPYFVRMGDGSLFSFAGLWSSWTDTSSGEVLRTCTIITTEPNALLAEIHDRMPVIVNRNQYGLWLNSKAKADELRLLFRPFDPGLMTTYPVSTLCNNAANDSRQCIEMK